MHKLLICILIAAGLSTSCKHADFEEEIDISGTWKSESWQKADGTVPNSPPYALLDFEYSDGFILHSNGTGFSMWYDVINDPEPFIWTVDLPVLTIEVTYPNGNVNTFEFKLTDVQEHAMMLESPSGHRYDMERVK